MDTIAELVADSPAATRRLGVRLGRLARAGDVIALLGTLGAGKTCFAQGLAIGLGVPESERVASPTFNIVLEHRGRVPLYHVDLYRLGDAGELDEIGLRDYLGGDGVAAVEWMDRFPAIAPADHLAIEFVVASERRRRLIVRGAGERSTELGRAFCVDAAPAVRRKGPTPGVVRRRPWRP